jgi:hypothetical protein
VLWSGGSMALATCPTTRRSLGVSLRAPPGSRSGRPLPWSARGFGLISALFFFPAGVVPCPGRPLAAFVRFYIAS